MRSRIKAVIRTCCICGAVTAMGCMVWCLIPVAERSIDDISSMAYYDTLAREAEVVTREQKIEDLAGEIAEDLVGNKFSAPELSMTVAGWIYVEGTKIDYPVMQETSDSQGYYLVHRPDGVKSSSGSLYIPEDDSIQSDNVIIYGHHMRNGSMFGSLTRYKERDWAMDHRNITLVTPDGLRKYKVIAVIVQSAGNRTLFWEDYIGFDDRTDSMEYHDRCRKMSVVDLPDIIGYGCEDTGPLNYLTLVTCEYSVPSGRLEVVAVEVPGVQSSVL
ncbi:sortase B [Ruminococcaceae bacterium YRB3002]|nr:sortase B [Ruminococcaceae bacterium YRB3002]